MAPRALLPPIPQLQALTDEQTREVIGAVDRANSRAHAYALAGMICGTISFLAIISSFTFLVFHGYFKSAGSILGAGVLTVIGRMIAARLP